MDSIAYCQNLMVKVSKNVEKRHNLAFTCEQFDKVISGDMQAQLNVGKLSVTFIGNTQAVSIIRFPRVDKSKKLLPLMFVISMRRLFGEITRKQQFGTGVVLFNPYTRKYHYNDCYGWEMFEEYWRVDIKKFIYNLGIVINKKISKILHICKGLGWDELKFPGQYSIHKSEVYQLCYDNGIIHQEKLYKSHKIWAVAMIILARAYGSEDFIEIHNKLLKMTCLQRMTVMSTIIIVMAREKIDIE